MKISGLFSKWFHLFLPLIKFLLTKKRFFVCVAILGIIFVVFLMEQITEMLSLEYLSLLDSNLDMGRSRSQESNRTWMRLRKELASLQAVSKVIILAHVRGGSTICSDIFNIETDNTILWYEALHGFQSFYSGLPHFNTDTSFLYNRNNFTRISLDSRKHEALTNYLTQLLKCDVENIPTELLTIRSFTVKSAALKEFVQCTDRLNAFERYIHCESLLRRYCLFQEHLGSPMEDIESLSYHSKCADILHVIRKWNPQKMDKFSTIKLLHRYMKEYNATNLKNTVISSCPKLVPASTKTREHKQGSGQVGPQLNDAEWDLKCHNLKHKFYKFVQHYECFQSLISDTNICRPYLNVLCSRTRLTVAEIQRVFLADLEQLIQRMPDIHIVHYVRDPRAISASRAEKQSHMFSPSPEWTAAKEAELLCRRMRYDSVHKRRFQQIYPGSVITVRYEDLIINPVATVKRMYDYFGRLVPQGLNKWIKRTMHAEKDDGMYGVSRSNAREHLSKWRLNVTKTDVEFMNAKCHDILKIYNYQL